MLRSLGGAARPDIWSASVETHRPVVAHARVTGAGGHQLAAWFKTSVSCFVTESSQDVTANAVGQNEPSSDRVASSWSSVPSLLGQGHAVRKARCHAGVIVLVLPYT